MTTATVARSLSAIEAELIGQGYHEGAPSHQAAADDRSAALLSACEACGNLGLEYAGWVNPDQKSYVAIATCACGHSLLY